MKKILILVGDCVEDSQIDYPQKTLLTLGYTVDVASPNKKPDDVITSSIFEPSDLHIIILDLDINIKSLLI